MADTGAACDLGEVVELDFQGEGGSRKLFLLQPFCQFAGYVVELDDDGRFLADVFLEGVFATDGFPDADGFYGAQVDAPGKLVI